MWCWERLLTVPWTSRRSNQSILKYINPKYSLQGLMLRQKLQYFGHLMRRANSLEMPLMLGKIEGKRRSGWQRMRWLDTITYSININVSTLGDSGGWSSLVCPCPWGHKKSDLTYQLDNNDNNIVQESLSCLSHFYVVLFLTHRITETDHISKNDHFIYKWFTKNFLCLKTKQRGRRGC